MFDLCTENDKALLKQTKLSKLKDGMCSFIGRPNAVKMAILTELIYRFGIIPIKCQVFFFFLAEINKLIIKLMWKL